MQYVVVLSSHSYNGGIRTGTSPLATEGGPNFSAQVRSLEIDGAAFGQIPLSDYTPDHTDIVTPDSILYVRVATVE